MLYWIQSSRSTISDSSEGYKKTALSGFEKQAAQPLVTADIVIESN